MQKELQQLCHCEFLKSESLHIETQNRHKMDKLIN